MPLDLPPKLILPQAPAIIRPAEARLLAPGYLPTTRSERRAALSALLRSGRLSQADAANAFVVKLGPALAMSMMGQLAAMATYEKVTTTFITSATDTSDQTTYNGVPFQGLSIGTAHGDRVVVVLIGSRANSARSISGVTIAGLTATAIATANNAGAGAEIAGIYAAYVPTGTTATFAITFSGAMLRCAIGVLTITGSKQLAAFATSTVTPTGTSPTTTINCPANGGIIAVNFGSSSVTATTTWTGLTERYDLQPETPSNGTSGASDNFTATQTGLTVTATVANVFSTQAMAVASWGP